MCHDDLYKFRIIQPEQKLFRVIQPEQKLFITISKRKVKEKENLSLLHIFLE
jgi:hypothetical protein